MKLALIATAAAAATIAVPATAHADNNDQKFASPSGDIRCVLFAQGTSASMAKCQIGLHTYAIPPGVARNEFGEPCEPGTDRGEDFWLEPGEPGSLGCTYSALDAGVGPWPTLNYGETISLGPISCDREPTGVTCTDSSTGHFFRVARDSYQVG